MVQIKDGGSTFNVTGVSGSKVSRRVSDSIGLTSTNAVVGRTLQRRWVYFKIPVRRRTEVREPAESIGTRIESLAQKPLLLPSKQSYGLGKAASGLV